MSGASVGGAAARAPGEHAAVMHAAARSNLFIDNERREG